MPRYPRTTRAPAKEQAKKPQFRCRDCAESYDWHSKAIDGHLILCRCKQDHKTEYGRWCKFLNDLQCEHFKPRKNE